ncbi:neo-calmodulin-like [Glandiceps talaboti]
MDYRFFDPEYQETDRRAKDFRLEPNQIEEYKDAFEQCDEDLDGFISAKDVGTLLKTLGQNPTEADLQQIRNEVDVDRCGRIDFDDFLLILTRILSHEDHEEEIREAFRVFDMDGKGYMHTEEIKHVLVSVEAFSESEVETMTNDLDINGDGRIHFNEFRTFLKSSTTVHDD